MLGVLGDLVGTIFLLLVKRPQIRGKLLHEISNVHSLSGVVGRERRASKSLSQDLVAGSETVRVEGCREDLALGLVQLAQFAALSDQEIHAFMRSSNLARGTDILSLPC